MSAGATPGSRGAAAEDLALRYLEAQGLKLLVRNWRCKAGELDLVMQDGATTVIAEVRSRGRSDYGAAIETIGWRKRQRLLRATQLWLMHNPRLAERPLRFDVVTLDGDAVEWTREAFDVNG